MSKKTLILLGTSFLLFLVAAIIRFTSHNRMREYTQQVEISRDLIVSLERLENHIKSAQIYSVDSTQGKLYNFFRYHQPNPAVINQLIADISKQVKKHKPKQLKQWAILVRDLRNELPVLMKKNVTQIAQSEDGSRFGALLRMGTTIRYMVAHEEAELTAQRRQLELALAWTDAVSLALVLIALLIFAVTFTHNLRLSRKERWLEGFLASVLNTSQAGIISYRAIREKGRITRFAVAYQNEAVVSLLGLDGAPAQKAQHQLEAFVNTAHLYRHFTEVVETGDTRELETSYNGRWLQLLLARRDDGVTLSIHNISAIKQYQEDLKNTIGQLERSNAELEQYAYAASHDLQEPLRKITTFGHLLNDTQADRLDEKGKRHLDKMLSSASRMTTLIRDLLAFSSLKRKAEFEQVKLTEILNDVLTDLELAIAQQDARIIHDDLPVIDAIPLQMHQLFFNLLNNALKFASPNRRPEVRISCVPATADDYQRHSLDTGRPYFKLMVADNGIGFEKEHANHIFGLFKRLNNRELYSGSGIGLALCKRVLDNHEGHIYAEGKEGQGARFYILIPQHHAQGQARIQELKIPA